jgi:glucokinase
MNPISETVTMQKRTNEATSGMTQRKTPSTVAAQREAVATADIDYVVGIDIGATNLRLALADMSGTIAAKWSSTTAGVRGAEAVIELIRAGTDNLMQQVSAPAHALKAVAAGAPGITDVDAGIVIATSYLMGWRDVPLRTLLEEALNAPAVIDNDVNLAAIGESWIGAAKGVHDFVFLAIGTGVGASIVLNGIPFRGTTWAAGEIGYMLIPDVSDYAAHHGKPGALENMIGGEGIKAQWQNLWSADNTVLPKDLTATQIFDHALAGDSLAQTILERTARLLSRTIYNVNLVLNCPLFVLGGGVGVHPVLHSATQSMLEQLNMRSQPQLTLSTLGTDAQLMGALRIALDLAGSRSEQFASTGAG